MNYTEKKKALIEDALEALKVELKKQKGEINLGIVDVIPDEKTEQFYIAKKLYVRNDQIMVHATDGALDKQIKLSSLSSDVILNKVDKYLEHIKN